MKDFLHNTLRTTEPSVFTRYLKQTGWEVRLSPSQRFHLATRVYQDGETKVEAEVEIPIRQDFADYLKRIIEAVDIISMVEGVSADDLVASLQNPYSDILAFRYTGEETSDGTIGIDDSIRIRQARKELLLSIAHSVVEPALHFPRLSRFEPLEFLKRCREMPSKQGSFVTEVIVPVPETVSINLQSSELEEPFARRATKQLSRALSSTIGWLEGGNLHELVTAEKIGVSANFLTALSHLKPPGNHGALEVNFRWASARPITEEVSKEVKLSAVLFEPLEEVARVLRETSKTPGYELSGYVATLKRAPEDTSKPGLIVVATTLEEHQGTVAVNITLEPKQYAEAVEAHRAAKQVRITGTLEKRGRRFVLENPGGLVVVEGADFD
jgi:hypothetical protein